jgi:hypothetical protein
MTNNTKLPSLLAQIKKLEQDYISTFDNILIEEGMKAFVLWAKAFPTRDLRFVSGMGTATWSSTRIDSSPFLMELNDIVEGRNWLNSWDDRAANMVEPLVQFHTLFWSNKSDFYKYPTIPEILYNPVTRTVECGSNIIQLPPIGL